MNDDFTVDQITGPHAPARNHVALLCLQSIAATIPLDAPRCVEAAFRMADLFLARASEPTVQCSRCRLRVEKSQAIASEQQSDVFFHGACVP